MASSPVRFLVYGGRGWIGGMFCDELKRRGIHYDLPTSRADDEAAVAAELDRLRPTHVCSFVGRTHGTTEEGEVVGTIDYLEKPGKLRDNVRDNLYGPITLALNCKKAGAHFTYMGTGCIFEYDAEHPEGGKGFEEGDKPNFFGSSYSTVKGFTDRLFTTMLNDTVLNLRLRMPIVGFKHHRNFVTKIVGYEKVCSVPNSMTVLDEFLPMLVEMCLNKEVGTFNFTNPGTITHNEVLQIYKEEVDKDFTWKNFTIEEQTKILAAGRSNNLLETDKLAQKYKITPIKDSVRLALRKMGAGAPMSKL